jgi:plastocyanin
MMKTIGMIKSVVLRSKALAFAGVMSSVMFCAVAAHSARVAGNAPSAAAGPPAATGTEVKIDNFAFNPAVITVKAGTQVIWINKDDIPHTVDSSEGKFKSAALDTDEKFEFKFSEPGEYPFFCRMHPKMTGKVIVQP